MRSHNGRGWTTILVAVFALVLAGTRMMPAQESFKTVFNFDETNGAFPGGGFVQGIDGNLYGSTEGGGAAGLGSVFKITPDGALTTLHSFCTQVGCVDQQTPMGNLSQDVDGNLYGTTLGGPTQCGTIFKITPAGRFGTIFTFCAGERNDGSNPEAGLTLGSDGDFYGTTTFGWTNSRGTIFKMTPMGTLMTLYDFCAQANCTDGSYPDGGVVQASDGNFYGTTYLGGANNLGSVFKVTPAGALTTLYSFCSQANCVDGDYPTAISVEAPDGSLYGLTLFGGTSREHCQYGPPSGGCGTVFKITPEGKLTTVHSFCSLPLCADGYEPVGALTAGSDGYLYGTTEFGGATASCVVPMNVRGCGTVFRASLSGDLITLHDFDGSDGVSPAASLAQSTNGIFYGTAINGGASGSCPENADGCGTVFSLDTGLGPFVETLPGSGRAGAIIKILGTQLKSASSVTFNGISASFEVISPTEISAAVPPGATTGRLQVMTTGGTLSSNAPFRVTP